MSAIDYLKLSKIEKIKYLKNEIDNTNDSQVRQSLVELLNRTLRN